MQLTKVKKTQNWTFGNSGDTIDIPANKNKGGGTICAPGGCQAAKGT